MKRRFWVMVLLGLLWAGAAEAQLPAQLPKCDSPTAPTNLPCTHQYFSRALQDAAGMTVLAEVSGAATGTVVGPFYLPAQYNYFMIDTEALGDTAGCGANGCAATVYFYTSVGEAQLSGCGGTGVGGTSGNTQSLCHNWFDGPPANQDWANAYDAASLNINRVIPSVVWIRFTASAAPNRLRIRGFAGSQ